VGIVKKNFSIHVWGNDHPPPHCHVKFKDGTEVCVIIPSIEPMYGASINNEVKTAIMEHIDELADLWDKCNPPRKFKIQPKRKKISIK
jgi:hypothetical protein